MNELKRMALSLALMAATTGAQAAEFVFGDIREVTPQEVVAYIEGDGDLNVRGHKDCSLIQWAAYHGEIEIARGLLDRGMDMYTAAPRCMAPLMLAIVADQPDMVAFLLGEGVDPARPNGNGYSALELWTLKGHPETLTHLLDAGSDYLLRVNAPGNASHLALPLNLVMKHNPWVLNTDAGRRLQRLTYEGTGCEGAIVLPHDKKLTILAERTLGKASRWKQIAELNGLGPDKSYRLGDCLKLPD